jgi:hypothetical protein
MMLAKKTIELDYSLVVGGTYLPIGGGYGKACVSRFVHTA